MGEKFDTLVCSGCGSTKVVLDPRTRIITCDQCGKEEKYTRRKLNANGKVINARENAIKFFIDGNYSDAKHYAQEVLNMAIDNAPALYITAYCEDVVNKKRGNMTRFFDTLQEIPLEFDEVEEVMKLFLASPYCLIDFEARLIEFIARNTDLSRDRKQMSDFFDQICPYFIGKRATISSFDPELLEMYEELATEVGIPKTVYALVSSIQKNPDSPFANNQFFLKSKVQIFYDSFVTPVGKIVDRMMDDDYKPKLQAAYNKLHEVYKNEANK